MCRKIFCRVLILTILIVFASFAGIAKDDFEWVTSDRIGNPDAPIVITWRVQGGYSLQSTSEARVNYLKKASEEWARRHPNVRIDLQVFGGSTDVAMTKLLLEAKEGRAPDISQIDSFYVPRFYDYLPNMDQYFTKEEINDWFDYCREEAMIGPEGHLRSLWFTTDVRCFWYRKDLVPTPPKTWGELIEMASRISKQEQGVWGLVYPAGRGEGTMMEAFLPGFWSLGGLLVDETGRPIFGEGKNREAALKVLNFIKETIDSGATPLQVVEYLGSAQMDSLVVAGQAAMLLSGNGQRKRFVEILEPQEYEKWEVAPLPMPEGGFVTSTAGGWNWGFFSEDPVKRALAIDFILDVYAGFKGSPGWCEAGGYLPPRKSVYEYYHYFASDPEIRKFMEYLETAKARPGTVIYPEISRQIQIAVGEVIIGTKSPEEALQTAWEDVLHAYEK